MRLKLLTGAASAALIFHGAPAWAAEEAPAAVTPADAEAAAEADADVDGGTIVVTGTRSRTARTIADSPVPIDVITGKELRATGRTCCWGWWWPSPTWTRW